MKHDERLQRESKNIESLAYQLLKWGLFPIIVIRLVALKQGVLSVIDIFALWLIVVTLEFIVMSVKGIPITFPISLTSKLQTVFFITLPIVSGLIAVGTLWLSNQLDSWIHGLITFGITSAVLIIMFGIYHFIYRSWEKKHTI